MHEIINRKLVLIIGVSAMLIFIGYGCGDGEVRYRPPDPMNYEDITEYQRDKMQYDKDYEKARDDYQAEHVQDCNW